MERYEHCWFNQCTYALLFENIYEYFTDVELNPNKSRHTRRKS